MVLWGLFRLRSPSKPHHTRAIRVRAGRIGYARIKRVEWRCEYQSCMLCNRRFTPHPPPVSHELTRSAAEREAKKQRQKAQRERRSTGAWPYNRPCAQQYVGKSQSCMVINETAHQLERIRVGRDGELILPLLEAPIPLVLLRTYTAMMLRRAYG
eukprot:COSAG05_NODE_1125_length_5794_cov_6.018450_8_plen_155_part_00